MNTITRGGGTNRAGTPIDGRLGTDSAVAKRPVWVAATAGVRVSAADTGITTDRDRNNAPATGPGATAFPAEAATIAARA